MITIQRLPKTDLSRIREIDRSEIIRTGYVYEDGRLTAMAVNWDTVTWPEDGPEDFSIKGLLKMLTPILEERDGVLLGALDGEALAGLAVLRPRLTETVAQIALPDNAALLRARKTTTEPLFDLLAQVIGCTDNHKQLPVQRLVNVRTCLALGVLSIQIAMIANCIWNLPLRSISHIGVAFT